MLAVAVSVSPMAHAGAPDSKFLYTHITFRAFVLPGVAPMSDTAARPPIVVSHEGGVRFAAQVRTHRVVVDQPHRGGGSDTAPSPIELLAVSLGTCIAYYVQQFCHARGLPYEGLRVEVDQEGASSPSRIAKFTARVAIPADLPPQARALIERVVRSCPAHNTLALGAEVAVSIAVGDTEGAPAPA
ncbi:MAG: OsmC family protein [Gemmatimonadaceae bacterium]